MENYYMKCYKMEEDEEEEKSEAIGYKTRLVTDQSGLYNKQQNRIVAGETT